METVDMDLGRPKILIVDNSIAFTGAFKSIRIFTRELSDQFEFIFVIPELAKTNEILEADGIRYFRLPFVEIQRSWKLVLYLPYLLLNTFRLMKLCRQQQVVIVHVNDLFNMCGLLMKIFRPSIKIVYHIRLMPHSYVRRLFGTWVRLISIFADRIVCVSKAVFNALPGGSKKIVIYDAIVSDKNYQEKAPRGNSPIQLLYLANYIPGKGHDHALRAFARVLKTIRHATLIMAGGDMGLDRNKLYKATLMDYARMEGMGNHIAFEEFVKDPEGLIRASDILLNFSDSESFSLTSLEALHWGTPLIATDSGGPSELIVNGQTGLLVTVGNVDEMVEAIIRLCLDESLRHRFAKAGVDHVQKNFSKAQSMKALSSVYASLIT